MLLNGAHRVMPHTSFDAHFILLLIEVAIRVSEKGFLTCQLFLLLLVPISTNDTVIIEVALPSYSIFFNIMIE